MIISAIKEKINELKNRLIVEMKNRKDISGRGLVFTILALFIVFLLVGNSWGYSQFNQKGYHSSKGDEIKITFGGDVSPSGYLKEISKKHGHGIYYEDIKDVWQDSDVTLINLEAALLAEDAETASYLEIAREGERPLDIGKADLRAMKKAGINLIGLANNHSMDYQVAGILKTIEILEEEELEFIGGGRGLYEAMKPYSLEVDGQRVGIMAMTDIASIGSGAKQNAPGVFVAGNQHRNYELERMVAANDFNMVYIHWGTKYGLKPDPEIKELGRELIELGIDLVVGSHPRVLLPAEKYKDGLIIYSLGSLVFDQSMGRMTDSVIANLYLGDSDRRIEFLPVTLKRGIPYQTDNRIITNRIFKVLTKGLDRELCRREDGKLFINF